MEHKSPIKISKKFDIEEVKNRFARKMRQSIASVTHIYNAVMNYKNESFSPMDTNGFPIIITLKDEDERESNTEELRENTLDWLYKKGFEDYVVALTESLIVAYIYSKIRELSIKSATESISDNVELDRLIEQFSDEAKAASFSKLMKYILTHCDVTPQLVKEMWSINNVRNCLVHRNGIVCKQDIKDDESHSLTLYYTEVISRAEVNGQMIEITSENKKNGGFKTNRIEHEKISKSISFKLGEPVVIDPNILNALSYICVNFVMELFSRLPRPDGHPQPEVKEPPLILK